MNNLEKARRDLYASMDSRNGKEVLEASRELDKLVLCHMYRQISKKAENKQHRP